MCPKSIRPAFISPRWLLFFVIQAVAFFEVVPIWLNHTLPAVLPHLKAVLERRFWNGLQLARLFTLNRLDVVEPLSFERNFQFWEHPRVAGSYVGTVRRLAKLYNLVFRQKLLHKVRWMRWRVIVVKKLVTAHTRVIPKILFKISQTVVFGIPKSFSGSRTVNRRSPSIASRRRSMFSGVVVTEGRPGRESLSTDVRSFLNRLYHSFICVMPILSSTKAFYIISIVSVQLLPR